MVNSVKLDFLKCSVSVCDTTQTTIKYIYGTVTAMSLCCTPKGGAEVVLGLKGNSSSFAFCFPSGRPGDVHG